MNKIFRVVWNQATQSWVAVSELTKAHKKQSSSNSLKAVVGTAAVLLSINTAQAAVAIGETTANNTFTQSSAQATGNNAVAIGQNSKATKDDTIALGTNSKSTNTYTVALGRNTEAAGQRSMAFGNEAKATANDTIAFGSSSEAKKNNDIIIGKEAKSRDEGGGHSVAVGYNATAGSTKTGAATDVTSTGKNTAAGGVAIGVSSYTGLNRNNAAINSSVAIGAGAGAGFRAINADGIPTGNGTDPDDNATVLAKAFGNTSTEAGNKDAANRFDYKGVDINEGTAVGRNTRAIGDQAVALGAQSIAGQGAIAIGGNDITQFANARYFMSNRDNFGVADVSDHDQSGTLASKNISQKYQELVGAALNTAYQATYAQNGSTVIGMQAHSTTPLGVAIGTNALVRKGAYGATAIGSGSAIQANAEAAVAIGMGSWVNGKFGVAAGTASRAEQSAVAAGYKANADKSAVAIGDSSNATTSSVAVGQLAQATKEADIAVGQGAKASGNQGAIAMGLGTNAQGDSSIMIGGSNISSAANQKTEFEKAEPGKITKKTVTEKINGQNVDREYTFAATKNTSGTIAQAYKELTGLEMDVSTLDFADTKNKNGHASTSLGVHALAKGNLATAIGASARADAIGSLALGTGAHATKQNAVAIGTGSTTDLVGTRQLSVNYDSDGKIVSDNSPDIAYTFKWAGGTNTSEGDVVSFGSSGAERQLKNVAAGRVAEDSTDAINGSQLNSITKKIAAGFNTSGNEVAGSSGVFTSKKANADSVKKDYETAIRSDDKVQLQVGNNLKLDRDETVSEVDVPDDFDKTKTVKKKIRKADFAYSLNPVLTNLTSAEFIGTGTDAPTTKLTNDGVTITPKTAGKKPVSLTQNGLDNGGNPITDVAGNLDGAKTGTTAPTNEAAKPDNADTIKNNAATVGDVLNAGWNLQEKGTAKDFVTAYDTVNFVDGNGTTVSVENTDNKISTIKYSVNTGNGLQKDTTGNTISVKPADKSLEVTNEGVKVKAADNTLTTDDKGLKVNTGNITASSVPTVADDDKDKIATVGNVAEAIKAAAWKATSAATTNGENSGKKDQEVKAGDTVTFEADKNIKITQADGKFTFATKENVTFNTVQVGGDQGPKLSKSDAGDLKVSGPNSTDPVKVTNVKDGDISADSKDAINGSQFHKLANNTIQLKGQTGDKAVTETNKQALNKENGIAFTVKSSDGTLLEVTAADDTITLTPKTATLTTGADGVPTADTTNGKLVTADQLVNTLTEMGWKATADKDGSGTVSGAATELIKAGNTVTFKAGDNLAVKQDGKNFIYSLQKELTGLTSAEFKNQAGDKTVINSDGMKITPKDAPANPVSLTKDGLDNGGKTVKNVTSGLMNYAEGTPKAGLVDLSKPASGNPTVPDTTAATVGDLRNMGWVVSSDKTTDGNGAYSEQVKNADEVKFVGKNAAKVSGKTENGVRTITVDVTVPETKTAELVSSKDGSVIAPSTNPELQKALKAAKDELAAAATPEQKEAAKNKVKAAETALNEAVDNKGVATAKNVADMINASGFTLKTSKAEGGEKDTTSTGDEVINPGKAVEMIAGKNLTVKQEANGKVTYSTKDEVEFTSVKVGDIQNGKAPVNFTTEAASPASNNGTDKTPTTALNVSSSDGKPTQLKGVGSVLNTEAQPTSTGKQGDTPATAGNQNLVNLGNDPKAGNKSSLAPEILNSAATVGDLANMGWVVSTKDGNGYTDVVKNANQVDFVGKNGITVTGKTGTDGVRTITVEAAQTPVVYTNKAGEKLVKVGDKFYKTDENGKPTATEVPKEDVIASMNNGDNTANNPMHLSNIGSNLPTVNDTTKQAFDPNSTTPKADKNNKSAPMTAAEAAELLNPTTADGKANPKFAGNNAATVSDVLNAGWNLQNNGEARDFVKPYDTVNFVDGINTKAVVTTDAEGKVSNVQIDVKDLPIAYTNEAGDKVVKAADGKYYKESDLAGKVYDPKTKQFKNADGTALNEQPTEVAGDTVKTNLVNPNAEANKAGNATQLGNVASGANTFAPVEDKKLGNDGKWYPADQVEPNGQPKKDASPVAVPNNIGKAGLIDFSQSNPNNAATVGDLQNLGWVVSAKGNDYSDQVRNANEVKFVGEGTASVTGKTDENGVRTITVKVDDQVSTNNAQVPVNYTTADGTKVYPVKDEKGNVTYHTTPDGKGKGDTEIPKGNVITSINGPEGTTAPTILSNVAGNLDGAKKDTKAPTTEHGPVNTTDKNAVNYVNPNNAATVGDVLNAGWNLQNNGDARDFVKPYDTVNFVDGINTKAVVTTDAEGKVSNVQIDVKDLPIAYTNEAGDKVVKAADGKYYKESDLAGKVYDPKTKQFKNADGTALNEQPTEVAGDTVKTNLVNPNAEANKAGNATQLGNVASGANTFAPVEDKKLGNDGKWYPADQVEPNGQPKKDASPVAVPNNIGKAGLIDFSQSNPNNAATVGDLQNLGWVVSAKGNDYSDQVRNANEVKFVGEGTASVTGKTDENGVRTITVKVDDQVSTNNAQVPVNYTTADGTKVYPVKDEKGNVTYHTTPDGKGKGDTEIPKGNVITSINGPEGTTAPTILSNVAGNLDGAKKDTKAPTTEHGPVNTTDKNAVNYVNPNNAATVGDVLNAGWNLQNNGDARDFVKPYDTVNFINGKGTKAVVETADNLTSTVKFDVDAGEITADETKPGAVKGPNTTGKNPAELAKNLADAQKAVDDLAKDPSATKDAKQKAQDALKAAQDAAAPLNKVATAQNVADMINKSGFTLKADKTEGDNLTAADLANGEMINPGDTITMKAGKNMSVKHEKDGSITYATKDEVEFNTVKVGNPNTYVDNNGKPLVKVGDNYYKPEQLENGKPQNGEMPVDPATVKNQVAPVNMKTEAATPANNNVGKDGNSTQPTTALNFTSGEGDNAKPTQLKGVGSVLDTKAQPTSTGKQGDTPATAGNQNLVNLGNNPITGKSDLAPEILNSAATVGDLANMGWIVGAPENGYVDTVKNANKVDFKGENGISVTGKTNDKGVREITISVAEGKVTNDVKVTKADGTVIDGVKGPDGKLYKKGPDGKPDTSKEITLAEGDKVNNEGSKFVSGNAVATAIQESGWNVGLADSSKANEAFNDDSKALSANKLEKVNPNDNVRFADGKGTKAAVATVERVDEFGKKVTDTYVKFDVDAGEITADTTKPGMVKGPVTADEAKKLADDLKKAEQAVKDLPADATPEAKKAAQDALKVAQDAAAPLNKVATAQNVAEAINNSGWRTNSTTATGGAKDTLINPGKAVNFESGKNMEVAQTVDKDGNVAYTYATKDDVQFNSVQFGDANGPKITNNGGNINVSGADGKAPTKITGVAAGDISPNSTDAVNGAQVYALSRGNVPNVKNITVDGKEYKNVIVDENGTPILKTYNVQGQKEIITNSVVEAIHNMNEQGIKFFHSNDGIERPKQEQTNSFDSSASGKFATAIGSKSSAEGTNAVAIGFNSVVTGNDSISIGTGNRVTGNNSGAFGDPSTVSGQGSYSVGNNNTVATNDTFVLGNKVTQTVENSVILGTKSTATAGDGSATGTLNNIKQDGTKGTSTTAGSKGTVKQAIVGNMVYGGFEGATADGVVSVGAAGNERRIQNVAAGEISATSTDAINGSQLYSVAQGVGNRLGDLNNKINRNNKNLRAGIAGANAAAGLPQVYIPGKSMVAASAGTYKGQSALAVGYSRASDNGKLILKLQGNANTRGDVGGSVGVGYQW